MFSNFVDLTKDDISEKANYHPEIVSDPSEINSWRQFINPFSDIKSCNATSSKLKFNCTESFIRALSTKYDEVISEKEVRNDDSDEKETQDVNNSSGDKTKIGTNIQQSYHVEFFNMILLKTKQTPYFNVFFKEDERNILIKFENLPENCQELYIRLFQRKKGWLKESKIQYNSIDCPTCLKLLREQGIKKLELYFFF